MHASRHWPERNLEYVSVASEATWRMRATCPGARCASITRFTCLPSVRLLARTYTAMTKANTLLESTETVERAAANTEDAIDPRPRFSRPCAPDPAAAVAEEAPAPWKNCASFSTSTPLAARLSSISGRRSANRGATVRADAISSGTSMVTPRTATPAMAMSTSTMLAMVIAPSPGRRPSGKRPTARCSSRSMPETGTFSTKAKPRPSSTGKKMSTAAESAPSTASRCIMAAYRQTPKAMRKRARRVF